MSQQTDRCQLACKTLKSAETEKAEQGGGAGKITQKKEWNCKTNWEEETLGAFDTVKFISVELKLC